MTINLMYIYKKSLYPDAQRGVLRLDFTYLELMEYPIHIEGPLTLASKNIVFSGALCNLGVLGAGI